MNETPYNEIDHVHCWTSKNPPCGQKIVHYKCCLCEKLNPKIDSNFISFEEVMGCIDAEIGCIESGNTLSPDKQKLAIDVCKRIKQRIENA